MPSSRHSPMPAGFCASTESGPQSTTQPSKRSLRMTPPGRSPASSTRTVQPRRCSSYAAERPATPPPTIATSMTGSIEGLGATGRARRRVDVLRQHLHVLHRRGRQQSVSEIEDVAGPPADALDDFVHLPEHPRQRPEQQRGIEVALDGAVVADARPRLVDRNPP